jgi:hypothetical protein
MKAENESKNMLIGVMRTHGFSTHYVSKKRMPCLPQNNNGHTSCLKCVSRKRTSLLEVG